MIINLGEENLLLAVLIYVFLFAHFCLLQLKRKEMEAVTQQQVEHDKTYKVADQSYIKYAPYFLTILCHM